MHISPSHFKRAYLNQTFNPNTCSSLFPKNLNIVTITALPGITKVAWFALRTVIPHSVLFTETLPRPNVAQVETRVSVSITFTWPTASIHCIAVALWHTLFTH